MVLFTEPAGPAMAMMTLKARRFLQAGHLVRAKWADAAIGKVAKLEPIDAHSLQIDHRMPERLPEPAHLALPALTQHHRQARLAVRAAEHPNVRRLESLPSHDHPLRESPQGVVTRAAPDHDPVFLLDIGPGAPQASPQ